jgi:hypothetical protein
MRFQGYANAAHVVALVASVLKFADAAPLAGGLMNMSASLAH